MNIMMLKIAYHPDRALIIHELSDRIRVSYSIATEMMMIFKDGTEVNSVKVSTISDLYTKLEQYYQDAQKLKQFK